MKRNAQGSGTIRKRKDGTWEARYTTGRDPGTGKQVRKSIYGKTQQEVRKLLAAVTVDIDYGIYKEPTKITFGEWLNIWVNEYCGSVKPRTVTLYKGTIKTRISPFLGHIRLSQLTPVIIQKYYNDSMKGTLKGVNPISPKTLHNVHGIIHKALQQAIKIGYLKTNPADGCALPKVQRKEMQVLDEAQTKDFIQAIEADPFRRLFLIALFTGMREGELLGLTWKAVDFEAGTIRIFQQLQLHEGQYIIMAPKNSKPRTISPAPRVIDLLREERTAQTEKRLKAGALWRKTDYVLTDEIGQHLKRQTVFNHLKKIAASIGLPNLRVHDLRHTYAVSALRAGIDVKTVSENLGHASAAFTLDIYGHVTDDMQRESARKMQSYIDSLNA